MSLATTKSHLIELLADETNKVIALSGKWGSGKSHLWREVKNASNDPAVKAALYVSLFGLTSMDQVKLKIVQSSIPIAGENPVWWDRAKKTWAGTSKVLESVHRGFGALNELALLAVPSLLKDRVMVLDDIERKHQNLSVDEVMGFIDEFTQQHGARVILILNSDQLADGKIWHVLREKVIDQELRLETTPDEAFDIALTLVPSPYESRLRGPIAICGVANIRIIGKVIRATNRILGKRADLSDDVLSRVIPSTVLLAATHFGGVENGPDFQFILSRSNLDDWGDYGKSAEDLDEPGKQSSGWRMLLQQLSINGCDEYERLVVEFLRSGLFDTANVARIIDRYVTEAAALRTQLLCRQLFDHALWHHRMTDLELMAEAREAVDEIQFVDASTVTSLHGLISGFPDGAELADQMIEKWIAAVDPHGEGAGEDFFGRPFHPRIVQALRDVGIASQGDSTLIGAIRHIANNGGWGGKQEALMRAAAAVDFESAIRNAEVDDLKLLMRRMVEMCAQPGGYRQHFGEATDNFLKACASICQDPGAVRLGKLIATLFEHGKIALPASEPAWAAPSAA